MNRPEGRPPSPWSAAGAGAQSRVAGLRDGDPPWRKPCAADEPVPLHARGLERLLYELPLPPLSEAAQKKLALRQKEAAADAGLTGQAFDARKGMLARVPGLARGNPGLQDLVGRKVVLSAAVLEWSKKPRTGRDTLPRHRFISGEMQRSRLPVDLSQALVSRN